MKIYLAGRYSRRLELCGYREQLRAKGHLVQARWLDGEHQISNEGIPIGEHGESLIEGLRPGERVSELENSERAAVLRQKFAMDDFQDVQMCDLLMAFTEPPRTDKGRGGRHVELGIALGMAKGIWIIGPRENIFCWLDCVEHFETFEGAIAALINASGPIKQWR